MAAGAGYIEFTTGDILTAAAANEYLASQVVMVFADAAARTSAITSPQEGMFSYLKSTNATQYYDGSAWTTLGGGAGGKVLQVVQATYSTQVNVSTSTPTDTGLTASITPSATSSKVLVIVSQNGVGKDTGATDAFINLLRGATTISDFGKVIGNSGAAGTNVPGSASVAYLDSPATTSSTTYKTQIFSGANVAKAFAQAGAAMSTITLMEIGA